MRQNVSNWDLWRKIYKGQCYSTSQSHVWSLVLLAGKKTHNQWVISIDLLPLIFITLTWPQRQRPSSITWCWPSKAKIIQYAKGLWRCSKESVNFNTTQHYQGLYHNYWWPSWDLTHCLQTDPALKHSCIMAVFQVCSFFPEAVVIAFHISWINAPIHAHELLL